MAIVRFLLNLTKRLTITTRVRNKYVGAFNSIHDFNVWSLLHYDQLEGIFNSDISDLNVSNLTLKKNISKSTFMSVFDVVSKKMQ